MIYSSTICSWLIKKYLLQNIIGLRTFMFLHNIYFPSLISFPILQFVTEMEDATLQYFNKKCLEMKLSLACRSLLNYSNPKTSDSLCQLHQNGLHRRDCWKNNWWTGIETKFEERNWEKIRIIVQYNIIIIIWAASSIFHIIFLTPWNTLREQWGEDLPPSCHLLACLSWLHWVMHNQRIVYNWRTKSVSTPV